MNTNVNRFNQQRKKSVIKGSKTDSLGFFNLLTSDELLDKVEALLPEHRERLFPPTETLSMFLAQAMNDDRSCQRIVNEAAFQRLGAGLPVCSTHTGAYCRARKRLPTDIVAELARHVGRCVDRLTPQQWRWHNRPVRLIDGTTVTMPDSAENQAVFPQQGGQKIGLGFPVCRVVGITCLASGALINAAIGKFQGKGGDEQTLLRSMQDSFSAGDIVLGDAFFATYFFIAEMIGRKVDILMEQQGARRLSTDFRKGKKLAQRDHVINIVKPRVRPHWMSEAQYMAAPESILVRECKVGGKILVTTMTDAKRLPKAELKVLYKKRWEVELDIRQIKSTLGMDILSCKKPEMAVKEIWIYLLAYNLIRLVMAQAATLADTTAREMSFKHCLQLWLLAMPTLAEFSDQQTKALFELMGQQRVGNRPGRVEPRAVKRRPKAYPLLVTVRGEARKSIEKNGHPKKLK